MQVCGAAAQGRSVDGGGQGTRTGGVFVFKTKALSRGCCIQCLSLYPKEVEYLYPPLTFLSFLGDSYDGEDGITYLDIEPQMS